MNKRKIAVLSVLALVFLLSIILISISSLRNIIIKGNTYYNEEAIKSHFFTGLAKENTVLSYLKIKYGKMPNIPFIDDVDVEFTGLHTLTVEIYEKEVVGCLPYMGEFICFDKDGIMVGSTVKKRESVPVITGIEYGKAVFNEKINITNKNIFTVILNITQLIKKYDLKIDEINFDNMNVKLFYKNIKILLGKRKHFDEQISNLKELLSKAVGLRGTLHLEEFSASDKRVVFEGEV